MTAGKKSEYFKVFMLVFVSMMVILSTQMCMNKGLFMYPSDYVHQQIPFYYHAADIVKKSEIGWDWYTDLGTDFISSYSYYLSGSIFFWIMAFFPNIVVIYLMPVMIALKTAIGGTGAFAYIVSYKTGSRAACMGAVMYSFSGFQLISLVYNSFYDITALFPFFLLSLDLLVKENKRGVFAVCTALTAITNYFFFIEIAVFSVIYYSVKCISGDFRYSLKSFLTVIFEAVIGTCTASVILIPSLFLIESADRVSDMLYGVNLISYNDNTIIPRILQGLFIMPDPCPEAMLFKSTDNTHNWASNSLYLPVFSVTGVAAYIKKNRNSWISRIIVLSFIFTLVPVLNSAFSLFNSSYYARWFFMPVLLMCLATSKALDEKYNLSYGIKIQTIALCVITVISFMPDMKPLDIRKVGSFPEDENTTEMAIQIAGMNRIPMVFWQCMALTVVSLLVVFIYNREKDNEKTVKQSFSAVILLTVIISAVYLYNGEQQNGYDKEKYYYSITEFKPDIDEENAYRISHANNYSSDNFSMIWGYMNAGCYHSTESNESDDFYQAVQGRPRLMKSEYREKDYPAYGLLSVKYLFNLSTNDELNVEILRLNTPGFSLYDKQGCYYIYKNDYFIPFGFMYDYCISEEKLDEYIEKNINDDKYQYKKLAMMRALVLSKEDILKYAEYIDTIPDEMLDNLDENTYYSDCNDRNSECCSSFIYNSDGFRAEITTNKSGLVYFSVPCSAGWSAVVNGKETEIIKAHYGLSAVAAESGYNEIEFKYETPGLRPGIIISMISLLVMMTYSLVMVKYNEKNFGRK